ncbi:MAG: glycosyltransferase family 4 protein [Prevotella sp.]|jgi:D-inositol-3-phosphate glycosyltransferase
MEKKKIFYIDPQSMYNLSSYDFWLLSEIDDEVYYFCSKHYDYTRSPKLIFLPYFSYNHIRFIPAKIISYLWSYLRILMMIATQRPDIVHVQWFKMPHFDYVIYKLINMFSSAKIIFTAHNILPHNSGIRYKGIYQKLYDMVDTVVVHTEDTKAKLEQEFHLPSEKVTVIRHGVLKMTVDKSRLQAEMPHFDSMYNLEGKFVFTSLGEQSMYKGIDVLINVWANTPELNQNPNYRLLIVGKNKGLDFSPLYGLNNVVFDNRKISNEEFYYLMCHTDIYLLPYRVISQSGAMLTALAERVPILVTEVGGLTDPLKIAPVGWSIPHCDYASLQYAMLQLVNHQHLVYEAKVNQENWDKVLKHYDWQGISRELQSLYTTITKQ